MRNKIVDAFMESLFGKPDFSKSFLDEHGFWRTPLGDGKLKIWRIDETKPAYAKAMADKPTR